MTEEDFIAWRDQPVTKWFLSALTAGASLAQATWMAQSWANGEADPMILRELRSKADAYNNIATADFETISAIHAARQDEHERD